MISNEMFSAIESDLSKKLRADRPLRNWLDKNGADAVPKVHDAIMAAILAAVYHSMNGEELVENLGTIESIAWLAKRSADFRNLCETSSIEAAATQTRLDLPMPSPPGGVKAG